MAFFITVRHLEEMFRSCYEINYTDCAGWFFEIKEENAAVPGRCSSGGSRPMTDGMRHLSCGQVVNRNGK